MKTFFLLLLSGWSALSASVTLAWDPNPPPVDGYNLYWGVHSRDYFDHVEVLAPATQVTVTGLEPGVTYFFAVTAWVYVDDGDILESSFSEEVSYQVPGSITPPQVLYSLEKNLLAWVASPAFTDTLEWSVDLVNWSPVPNGGAGFPRRGAHYVYPFFPWHEPINQFFRLKRELK